MQPILADRARMSAALSTSVLVTKYWNVDVLSYAK